MSSEYGDITVTVRVKTTHEPIQGATVSYLRDSDSVTFHDTTNASGVCTTHLSVGLYYVSATATDYVADMSTEGNATVTQTVTATKTIDMTANAPIIVTDFWFKVVKTVSPTIPIAGAVILLSNGQSQTTDVSGLAHFTNLPSADYMIQVTASGYIQANPITPCNISSLSPHGLTVGDPKTYSLDALPPVGGNLTIQVYDYLTHAALRGVSVYIFKTDHTYFYGPTTTNNLGQIVITNLPVRSGLYDVTLSAAGYTTSHYTGANLIQGTTFTEYPR